MPNGDQIKNFWKIRLQHTRAAIKRPLSIRKSDFVAFKSKATTVTFHFSKVTEVKDDREQSIDFLNKKLFTKNFSDISFVNTGVETLISVKTWFSDLNWH